jgi:phosphosulfolactate phosphohydrolase-like enzyme
MSTILLVTLSNPDAVVTAIRDKRPDKIWIITTSQKEGLIPEIFVALEKIALASPQHIGTTITKHDNLRQVYRDASAALESIRKLKPDAIYIDLTGGTVPMSIGLWEASKKYPDALVNWTDFLEKNRIHILSLPNSNSE